LALSVAAQACKEGGQVCYIDWENAIAPGYAADIGVPIYDPDKFILAQPNTLEEGMKLMWIMGSAGVDLIVLDSVSAGVPEEIWKQKMDAQGHLGRLGLHAAKWSAFLPKIRRQISKSGTAIVAISQLREKINTGGFGHGDSTSTSGGRAWKFYPDIRLKLSRVKQESSKQYNAMTHKMEDQKSSGVVRAKIEKSKISDAQGKEQDFYIRYGYGIDDVRSLIDLASRHGIVKKSGAWYIWETPDGEEIRGQGIEKFRFRLEDSGNFENLKTLVLPIIAGKSVNPPEEAEDGSEVLDDIKNIMDGFEDPEEESTETDS
jgi:recombination protein RecA